MSEIEIRAIIEFGSTALCFILLWFMVKPYRLTRETRYLALPLGFGFLGLSYLISGIAMAIPNLFENGAAWLQLFPRAFAFIFLAITYYFANRQSDSKSRIFWNLNISLLLVALVVGMVISIIVPLSSGSYRVASASVRVLNLICISYISVHLLRNHLKDLDSRKIWSPIGYFLLGVGQYLLLIWLLDGSLFAFWSALAIRLIALAIFLTVSYLTFFTSNKKYS
jgi:hypothetical protein